MGEWQSAAPYSRMLSSRTRVGGSSNAPNGPGTKATYEALFGDTPYADIPEELSIFGPGAYFADLMALVERTITDRNPGLGPLSLRNRRPDLWNLLLDPENTSEMVSNADLARGVLESAVLRLGPPATSFPAASVPAGTPGDFVVTGSWPASFTAKSTYLIDSGSGQLSVGTDPVGVTTTIRNARWMQTIAITDSPLTLGALAGSKEAPDITLEGFNFTFGAGSDAKALLRYTGGTVTLRNCVFSATSPAASGWAIDCATDPAVAGMLSIENCTFVDATVGTTVAPIDTTGGGDIALGLADSIVWTEQPPGGGYSAIVVGSGTTLHLEHCDIRGGKGSVPSGPHTDFADTNFDLEPGFADSTPPYTRFEPSSPVIGAGSGGDDIGAALDLSSLMAWGVYPFEFPLDLESQRARLAIDAVGSDITEIGDAMTPLPAAGAPGVLFPLSELGLSLADYVTLATPRSTGVEPYYGLTSFDDEAVTITPAASPGRWAFPAPAFAKRIGLSLDELAELVYQDLGPTEIAAGIQAGDGGSAALPGWNGFFVNGYGDPSTGALELRTQPVPVGRYAPRFAPDSPGPIEFPPVAPAPADSFTVSMWLLPESSGAATILESGTDGSEFTWRLSAEQGLEIVAGTHTLVVDVSAFLSAGQWFAVTTVVDHADGSLRVYLNGEVAGELESGAFPWPNSNTNLGGDMRSGLFAGSLGDLTIWGRALDATEIAETHQRPAVGHAGSVKEPIDGLVAFWPINDDATQLLDWASPTYPTSPNNGLAAPGLEFGQVGLPKSTVTARDLPLVDGTDFVEVEVLTATGGGLSMGNLDRVSRFVRLSSRLGWSFADLEWALFILFSADGAPQDFTDPAIFAGLADIADATARIGLPLQQVCAMMGPLKPFGRGRLGDDQAPFDQVFNAPPLTSPVLRPEGRLTLSVVADFSTPGPASRRLAAALNASNDDIAILARNLASGDTLTLDGDTLARFYALRLLADLIGGNVQSVLRVLNFTGLEYGRSTPAELRRLTRETEWIEEAEIAPVDLHVLVPPRNPAVPDPYDTEFELQIKDALPELVAGLERSLNASRVGPTSFIAPDVDAIRSAEIFDAQVEAGLIDSSGLITSKCWGTLPVAPYEVPSVEYPTIEAAVAAASTALNAGRTDLATVLISPGTYDGAGSHGLSVTLKKGTLAINARQANGATVIDCKGAPFLTIDQQGTGGVVISGLTVQNGVATSVKSGGAVTSNGALTLVGCRFLHNHGAAGGAIAISGGTTPVTLAIESCLFYGNTGGQAGALTLSSANAAANGSTFYGNTLETGAGSGFSVEGSSTLELEGSIAWDVTTQPSTEWTGTGQVSFHYSDLHWTPPTDESGAGDEPSGTGCVYTDPLLVDPARGLFEPGPGSPCIGTGPDGQNMGFSSASDAGGGMGQALLPFAYAQIEALRHALTDFFEDDRLPLATVLDLIGRRQNGLEILTPSGDPAAATEYLRKIYRYLLLAFRFRLDASLLNLVLTEPELFSLNTTTSQFEPHRGDIRMLAAFTALRDADPEATMELVTYLRSSAAGTAVKPPVKALAAIFGWDADLVKPLLGEAVPLRLGPVVAVAKAIGLSERTGIDPTLLLSLAKDGLVFGSAGAAPLLQALAATDSDLATGVEAVATDLEREALRLFVIPLIDSVSRPAGFRVTGDDELSDYLLMDVDMGVQTTDSRLVHATLSLQQYVERCRLGFEPGVNDIGLTETEWDWYGGYRTWQANRKVFVHPEDYVRPELRRDKTATFRELERSISSTPPTKEGLERLFKQYVDQFLIMAGLETVGSWFEPADRVATCLEFEPAADPSNFIAYCASEVPPQFPALTVEAWVRLDPVVPGSADIELIALGLPGGSRALQWQLYRNGTTDRLTFEVYGSPAAIGVAAPPGTLDDGSWHHVATVFEPEFPGESRLTLYLDGTVVDQQKATVDPLWNSNDNVMQFGQLRGTGPGKGFAEARVWATARSAEQIRTNMHRAMPIGSPDFGDLRGLWQFRDETLSDRTGNWSPGASSGDFGIAVPEIETATDAVTEDTWHFVGRTSAAPYSYHHRTKRTCSFPGADLPAEETAIWNGWEPVRLTINSAQVSPVVIDGRLHLFWVEGKQTPADSSTKPDPTPAQYFGVIKYSRQNADGTWAAPQSPFPDVHLPGKLDDLTQAAWHRPYVLPITHEGQSAILVVYGQGVASGAHVTTPATFVLKWDGSVDRSVNLTEKSFSGREYWSIECEDDARPTSSSLVAAGLKSVLAANGFETHPQRSGIVGSLISISGEYASVTPMDDPATAIVQAKAYAFSFGNSAAFAYGEDSSYLAVHTGSGIDLYESAQPQDAAQWKPIASSIVAGLVWPQAWVSAVSAGVTSLHVAFYDTGATFGMNGNVATSKKDAVTNTPWVHSTMQADHAPCSPGELDGVPCFFGIFEDTVGGVQSLYITESGNLNQRKTAGLFRNSPKPLLRISAPVFWEKTGLWYVLGVSADKTRSLWKAKDLYYDVGWDLCANSPSPIVSDQPSVGSGTTLLVTESGLICDNGPLLSEWTRDPDKTTWNKISGVPDLPSSFGIVFEQDASVEILGKVRHGSHTTPVTNQLGAFTVRSGADGFLVRARDTTDRPVDAQVRAVPKDLGVIQLEGTSIPDFSSAKFDFERLTTSVGPALSEALAIGGIDGLMSAASQNTPESDLKNLNPQPNVNLPVDPGKVSFSLGDAFGCYFRELFLFVPWLIAERLDANGLCEDARRFYEYIFKPSDAGGGGDYWRSVWLANAVSETALGELERPDPAALARYREDPFDAGAIADLRPVAYQRAIVTAYIRNLIDWGDDEFRINTRESINQAAQMYRFAAELLGPRPRHIEYTPPAPESYAELRDQILNEFLVSDELPPSASGPALPVPLPPGAEPNGNVAGLGFYFGLPDSQEFLSNWDLVEDRLGKIRDGLDITGEVDDLPLFAPPLSVEDIQALGQAGDSGGVGNAGSAADTAAEDGNRFLSLMYAARSMAGSVIELSNSLLRAIEMNDAESLAELQVNQQSAISERIRQIREEEVNNAQSNAAMVKVALESATFRKDFYKGLIDGKWSAGELIGIALATESLIPRAMSGVENSIAAPLFLIPEIFGLADGGMSPGAAMQAEAASSGDLAGILGETASLANQVASFERRSQEWEYQRKIAEFDVTQLQRQAEMADRQLRSAQLQFSLDDTTLNQTRAVGAYYASKFTNADLYGWMSGTLEQLNQQLFQIALGMAQLAQSTLAAITGEDGQSVSTDSWNSQRRGLLAGETLLVDLSRLEQAYWQWDGSASAQLTTKRISLKQIDPAALLQLRTTGSCTFRFSEELFDRDLPGQYLRTIKSVSLTLPGMGEHRHQIFGTLTCLGHETVRRPDGDVVDFLLGGTGRMPGSALRRGTRPRPVAISHDEGGEPGAFGTGDLNSLAGVGAVSTWRIDLPPDQNRVDLRDLEDVTVNLTFTSRDGGPEFRARVVAALPPHRGTLLVELPRVDGVRTGPAPADGSRIELKPEGLPRNLPGKEFQLLSLHLVSDGAGESSRVADRIEIDRPGTEQVVAKLEPLTAGSENLLGTDLAEPLGSLPEHTWSLAPGPPEDGSAPGRSWILAVYQEAEPVSPEVGG